MNKVLENTVIECLDLAHGQEIKNFFIENGIKITKSFDCTKKDDYMGRFYGVINGRLDNINEDEISDSIRIATIAQLRAEIEEQKAVEQPKTFPRKMWVWDDDENKGFETYVIFIYDSKCQICYPVICVDPADIESYENGSEYGDKLFKHASEINPAIEQLETQIKELTDKLNELKKQL